jgi:hypothetical protein
VLTGAAAARREIRLGIQAKGWHDRRNAEQGEQQNGTETPQAIIVTHFERI